jgi:hypothetical protein
MTEDDVIARFGLPPRAEALDDIRRALAAATALERSADPAADTLAMRALCVQLFTAGHIDDTLAIWRAKNASFDAHCSIDVQLLCGAGFASTRRHLEALATDEARAALAYLAQCDAAGDFDGHDQPDGRLARARADYLDYYSPSD